MTLEMKILLLSTFDTKGGAARAAYRLHQGLLMQGQDSRMFVAEKYSQDPTVTEFRGNKISWYQRRIMWRQLPIPAIRYWRSRPQGYGLFSGLHNSRAISLGMQIPDSDIVNLHWVAQFLDLPSIFDYVRQNNKVLFWTLHDMNPFTGGCHYSYHCSKYIDHCGACPQLGSNDDEDLSNINWKGKNRLFLRLNEQQFHLISPSRWLANQVKKSSLLESFPVHVIPYGINLNCYRPFPKDEARTVLGLPARGCLILFSANYTAERRKGFHQLREAFRKISSEYDIKLVSMGKGEAKRIDFDNYYHLGMLEDETKIAYAYSAADIYVIPSLADNLPNTVIEAMACGTPVVGFSVGGIPDIVREGETGLLVAPEDTKALNEAMVSLLDNHSLRRTMSANCRAVAEAEYSVDIQAKRYISLYEEVLAVNNKH